MVPWFIILALCLSFSGCSSPEANQQKTLRAFARSFVEANESSDIEAMLQLYELEGSRERTVRILRHTLLFELNMPIEDIQFEPLHEAPEETIRYQHQGIQYGPTLLPRLRMRVRYKTEDRFVSLFTIGQNAEGEWKLISSRPL